MRYLLILFLNINILLSYNLNIKTFSANFEQIVTSANSEKIVYKGKIKLKEPYLAYWEYIQPISKKIYINNIKVVIIEPELEQAIVTKLDKSINLFYLLKKSKKVSSSILEAKFNNRVYYITLDNKFIKNITYIDELDNKIMIKFTDQINNKKLLDQEFKYNIPIYYDIIKN